MSESLPPVSPSLTPAGGFSFQPPWSELTELGAGAYRLRLGGFFGPTWMALLCGQLAAHQLSVERAHAIRARNQSWNAEFVVHALAGAPDPAALPFVEFAVAQEAPETRALALRSYELVQTEDHGGTLRLTIDADDTLGLLGALLAAFAQLALFPVEMHIDTRAGLAHDSFWLGAVGGTKPGGELCAALEQVMARALRA